MDAQTSDAKIKRDVTINGGEGLDVNLHAPAQVQAPAQVPVQAQEPAAENEAE